MRDEMNINNESIIDLPEGDSPSSETFRIAIDRERKTPTSVFQGDAALKPWAHRYKFISWSFIIAAIKLACEVYRCPKCSECSEKARQILKTESDSEMAEVLK